MPIVKTSRAGAINSTWFAQFDTLDVSEEMAQILEKNGFLLNEQLDFQAQKAALINAIHAEKIYGRDQTRNVIYSNTGYQTQAGALLIIMGAMGEIWGGKVVSQSDYEIVLAEPYPEWVGGSEETIFILPASRS